MQFGAIPATTGGLLFIDALQPATARALACAAFDCSSPLLTRAYPISIRRPFINGRAREVGPARRLSAMFGLSQTSFIMVPYGKRFLKGTLSRSDPNRGYGRSSIIDRRSILSRRPLLKLDRWNTLLAVPSDEDALIRYCTLDPTDLGFVMAKRASHNRLGLALQLCLMRHPGRAWLHDEALPIAMIAFVAEQIDVPPEVLADYGRRDQNRWEHAAEAQRHLGLHVPGREDRRAALAAALQAAEATDRGQPIAEAMIAALRERCSVLPAADTLDRLGRAARALARRRMEVALLDGLPPDQHPTRLTPESCACWSSRRCGSPASPG